MPADLLTKEGRKACWDAKDNFWKCVDDNNGDHSRCKKEREIFERDCSNTWVRYTYAYIFFILNLFISLIIKVKYFDRRRGYLQFKNDLESGKLNKINDPDAKK